MDVLGSAINSFLKEKNASSVRTATSLAMDLKRDGMTDDQIKEMLCATGYEEPVIAEALQSISSRKQAGVLQDIKDSLTPTPKYPTKEEVFLAGPKKINHWYNALPPPMTRQEMAILQLVRERFGKLGGDLSESARLNP